MPYLEIPLPARGAQLVSIGDQVTVNAFTTEATTHEVVDIRPSSPSIMATITIKVPAEGINIPQSAMIQAPYMTWACTVPLHVAAEEDPMGFGVGPHPGVMTKPGALQPTFGIDWDELHSMVAKIIMEGGSTIQYEIGELILSKVLQPIVESFVGWRSDQAGRRIEHVWQGALARIEQEGFIPKWHWEPIKEKMLPVAAQIIDKCCAVPDLPQQIAQDHLEESIGGPAPEKRKIERRDAPWQLDE
jgi:hypothetical protein